CGINLRLMRYSDVLLRAAECINEVEGPNAEAIGYINQVRQRVALPALNLSDFSSKDKLFEQIANVERPKEFGCENGRGIDLLRWGFFYASDRLEQIKQHSAFLRNGTASTAELDLDTCDDASFNYFRPGHEYFPIFQGTRDANPNLHGNSANTNTDNSADFISKYGNPHPVVSLK
ncbi:MAG: RagB/SusD family nutrient uptake outer membrane protein, partial [Bacteroidales bacterium]|nr:RagB/SusD family nutrient uptake outer membrane protein [Bacteroidales bacterium]